MTSFIETAMERQARITAEAREIQFRRVFLTVLASMFYAVGWTARKVLVVAWLAVAWSWTAVKLGWTEAAPKRD